MCRLYAKFSRNPANPESDLVQAPFSLLKQGNASPKNPQTDGWGMAALDGERWRTVKSKGACFREKGKFKKAAESISSRVTLAHIRRASNPRGLPRSRIIGLANCQPFTHKNLAFVHNGSLNIPDEVARNLGPYRKLIKGKNDSEVLFALFVKHQRDGVRSLRDQTPSKKGWTRVFRAMVKEINQIWRRIPPARRRHAAPFHGLNMIASDGKTLAAHCLYGKTRGRSLCGQARPYFEMCYNVSLDGIMVASEPLDDKRAWKRLKNGEIKIWPMNSHSTSSQK